MILREFLIFWMHNLSSACRLTKTNNMHNSFSVYITKKLFQFIFGITFLFLYTTQSFAQKTDSIKSDTVKVPAAKYHSPKKAALFSAVLPGSGQIYNKKYWKVPVIYVGFAGLAYSFQFNQSRYVKYRDALKYRIDDDVSTTDDYVGIYTDEQLTTLYKYYHRYRDLTVAGGLALYLLNVVDAAVDAHLFTFNVSDDLSLNIHPALINTAGTNRCTTGVGLHIVF
jgi:hypothetical protein